MEQSVTEPPPSPYVTRTGRLVQRPSYYIEETSRLAEEEEKGKQKRTRSQSAKRQARQLQAEYRQKIENERKKFLKTLEQQSDYSQRIDNCTEQLNCKIAGFAERLTQISRDLTGS